MAWPNNEPSCSCCGVPRSIYQMKGHDRECVWYEDEMYRLAVEWKNSPKNETSDWKERYDLIVGFLLDQVSVGSIPPSRISL